MKRQRSLTFQGKRTVTIYHLYNTVRTLFEDQLYISNLRRHIHVGCAHGIDHRATVIFKVEPSTQVGLVADLQAVFQRSFIGEIVRGDQMRIAAKSSDVIELIDV